MVAFLPAVLPGFNYMLDVPVQGLGLSALCLFMSVFDQKRTTLSIGLRLVSAGLLCAVAMQTKFTAVIVVPGLFLVYGWLSKRWLQAIVAIGVAVLLFSGWECYLWMLYGKSHFLGEIGSPQCPRCERNIR
ncbi:MAG: hypothetical protein QM703_30015 [Gemmatales bacterium]